MLSIHVPCKDEEEAKKIGKTLVEEKLICCANIVPKIYSIYPWKGKIEEESESLLILKTNSDYETVRKRIEELHSYEVPGIFGFETKVNKTYKDWSEKI